MLSRTIPVVNLFCELFSATPPPITNIESILQSLGLIGALLLSSVIGFPSSFSVEELEEVNRRFRNNISSAEGTSTTSCWYKHHSERDKFGDKYSDRIKFYYSLANNLISSSLFSMVITYTFLSSYNYAEDYHGYRAWWRFGRVMIGFIFFTLVFGCIFTYLTFGMLMEVKFPYNCMVDNAASEDLLEKGSMTDFNYLNFNTAFLAISLIFSFLVLGIGSTSRYNATLEK